MVRDLCYQCILKDEGGMVSTGDMDLMFDIEGSSDALKALGR